MTISGKGTIALIATNILVGTDMPLNEVNISSAVADAIQIVAETNKQYQEALKDGTIGDIRL